MVLKTRQEAIDQLFIQVTEGIKKANKATVATVRTLMQSAGTWDDGLYTGEVCPETGVPNDTGTKAYPVGGGPHPYATGT